MRIYIPSKGRLEKQFTWDRIPEDWRARTAIVCPPEEIEEHQRRGRNAIAHPANCKGIGKVRQWIVETCPSDKFLMSDDDHKFFKRQKPGSVALIRARPIDMQHLLKTIENNLDEVVHVGVGARQGNNNLEVPWMHTYRYNNMYGMRKSVLEKHDIRFDAMPLMEDFYVNLSLLTRGYNNRVYTQMCWNQYGSNAAGGCSTYRNAEMQSKAAHMLHEFFPQFVKVVQRESTTMWEGMEVRDDVRILWKKAYRSTKKGRFM